jgi:NADP-dependent 3-hydroxy acid dehydrogenase YdfG
MANGACVVVGVGPGGGAAIASRFAEHSHPVALCARNVSRLNEIASRIPGARSYEYDVRDPAAAATAFEKIRSDLGPVAVLVYNAGAGAFKNVDDATVDEFQAAWEVNARGLFVAVKQALPDLRSSTNANIVVIGATASIRGGASAAPFASAKSAQRSLAQSLARQLGPEGIHVSYVIVDGVINLERTRRAMPKAPDEFFIEPAQIADSVYFLTQQRSQAWTFELDLRPSGEKW